MNTNGHVNGTAAATRTLRPGVWAPIPTFMDDNEELGEPHHL
jgi:hypothetical protein